MKYLNIYIENENKQQQSPEDAENKKDELMQQSAKHMAEAKKNMPKAPKMPTIKAPKLK
jgi:hypothetical protein